jgi:hypothetical protein
MTTEIKLYTSEGKPLTNLTSADDTICLPESICVNSDGAATALHADSGDVQYESLSALAEAYRIELDAVLAQFADSTGDNPDRVDVL